MAMLKTLAKRSETMDTYHKIQTVFKRNPANKHKTLLEGEYSLPDSSGRRNIELSPNRANNFYSAIFHTVSPALD